MEPAEDSVNSISNERAINNTMRHKYRVLTDFEKLQMRHIKNQGQMFLDYIDSIGSSREYSLAKTNMEQAVMWAVKGLTQ